MTDDTAPSQFAVPRWLDIALAISIFCLLILFHQFGLFQYFWITSLSVTAISLAIWENRSYHHEFWFWFMLLVFVLFHAFLVLMIGERHWMDTIGHGNGRGFVGIAVLDGLIMTGIIRFPDWITKSLESLFGVDEERTAK